MHFCSKIVVHFNSQHTPKEKIFFRVHNYMQTNILPILMENKPLTGQNGLFASAAFDKNSNEIILKLVNSTENAKTGRIVLESSKKLDPNAKIIILKSDNTSNANSLEQPALISPVEQELIIKGKTASPVLEPNSFAVIRIKVLK